MEHTKGPWMIGEIETKQTTFKGPYINITTNNGWMQPAIAAGRNESETIANARLIAAAPELLETLKRIVENYDNKVLFHSDIVYAIDAIANAEGRG